MHQENCMGDRERDTTLEWPDGPIIYTQGDWPQETRISLLGAKGLVQRVTRRFQGTMADLSLERNVRISHITLSAGDVVTSGRPAAQFDITIVSGITDRHAEPRPHPILLELEGAAQNADTLTHVILRRTFGAIQVQYKQVHHTREQLIGWLGNIQTVTNPDAEPLPCPRCAKPVVRVYNRDEVACVCGYHGKLPQPTPATSRSAHSS